MKKYKLIKTYPGSPDLGTKVQEHNTKSGFYYDEHRMSVLRYHVENQPEYWEEVRSILFVVSERDYNQGNYTFFQAWTVYKIYEDNKRDSLLNYFKTKEEADYFIIKNKPCLSLQDVSLILGGLDKKRDVYLELKRIVKEKI